MASVKVKDIAVKTGTYQKDGQTKGRYENVGSLMKQDDGSFFILLKRTFNPAGVHVEDGRDQIIMSVFDLKEDQSRQSGSASAPAQRQDTPPPVDNDAIPF